MNNNVVSMIANYMKPLSIIVMDDIYNGLYINNQDYHIRRQNYNILGDYEKFPRWVRLHIHYFREPIFNVLKHKDRVYGFRMEPLQFIVEKVKIDIVFMRNEILRKCTNIQQLYLAHEYMMDDIPNTLIHLKNLNISGTDIYNLPNTLTQLKYLNYSNIHEHFYTIPTKTISIPDTYIHLKDLDCSFSSIFELPDTLIHLEYLNCSSTNIRIIHDTFINLRELSIYSTHIKHIPDTLNKLKNLNCSNTRLKEIPLNIYLDTLYCYSAFDLRIYNTPKELHNIP